MMPIVSQPSSKRFGNGWARALFGVLIVGALVVSPALVQRGDLHLAGPVSFSSTNGLEAIAPEQPGLRRLARAPRNPLDILNRVRRLASRLSMIDFDGPDSLRGGKRPSTHLQVSHADCDQRVVH